MLKLSGSAETAALCMKAPKLLKSALPASIRGHILRSWRKTTDALFLNQAFRKGVTPPGVRLFYFPKKV
jgi:hypothetical protein